LTDSFLFVERAKLTSKIASFAEDDSLNWEPESDAIQIVIPDELMKSVSLSRSTTYLTTPAAEALPKVSFRLLPETPPHAFKPFWIRPHSYIRFPG
jgi:hypothetical protein